MQLIFRQVTLSLWVNQPNLKWLNGVFQTPTNVHWPFVCYRARIEPWHWTILRCITLTLQWCAWFAMNCFWLINHKISSDTTKTCIQMKCSQNSKRFGNFLPFIFDRLGLIVQFKCVFHRDSQSNWKRMLQSNRMFIVGIVQKAAQICDVQRVHVIST